MSRLDVIIISSVTGFCAYVIIDAIKSIIKFKRKPNKKGE
jgi:hypothetical protein